MSTREEILDRIRRNQPAPAAMPAIPPFAQPAGTLLERFKTAVARMGGRVVDARADADLTALVRNLFPDAKVVASATSEVTGNRDLATVTSPADLADVDIGIVRAEFGVAETGSLWLTSENFKVDSLGFLAQHLVVLIDPATIVGNLHDAYAMRDRFDARYGVFMTGPSATADIEGILIHGAQGIRSMTVVPLAVR